MTLDNKKSKDEKDYKETLVAVNRVTKVVKGGKRFGFNALVVVGNENGQVGCGVGKAKDVPSAVQKAGRAAKRNLVNVPMVGTTIPHEVIGAFGAGRVLLKPASPGTGIIAGGAVRAVLEAAGYKDMLTKCLRTRNHFNVVRTTIKALTEMQTREDVKRLRR
ncbi:MAG: 30S ribosomal protein S5 [bacterium]|nr:30S ribosomal protein S5 [bacterium]